MLKLDLKKSEKQEKTNKNKIPKKKVEKQTKTKFLDVIFIFRKYIVSFVTTQYLVIHDHLF